MKNFLTGCLLTAMVFLSIGTDAALAQEHEITPEIRQRAEELVSKMTLEEKIAYIGGAEDGFYLRSQES